MKNNKLKVLLVVALLVIVGGGLYFLNGGDLFQGKLSLESKKSPSIIIAPEDQPIVKACDGNALVVSLASISPSGSRNVSVEDEIITFDVNANEATTIQKIRFHVTGEPGDITTVYTTSLRFDTKIKRNSAGDRLPFGTAYLLGSNSYVTIDYLFDTPLLLESGYSDAWSLKLNSSDLIDEDGGADDNVVVQVTDIYDTSSNKICTNLPISGNTLAY